jgi:hypothetical protein
VYADAAPLCWIRAHADSHSAPRIRVHESWDRLYLKAAKAIPDARLRSLCRRRRAAQPVIVSALYAACGMKLRAIAALAAAAGYCWRYGQWWRALGKAVIRPLIPATVRARYRRRRYGAAA